LKEKPKKLVSNLEKQSSTADQQRCSRLGLKRSNWNLSTDKVRMKMFDHIKFISEYIKKTYGDEKSE
jgi:hypothetical protein